MATANVMKADSAPAVMSCLEVWGSNTDASRDIVLYGLDAWMYSRAQGYASKGGDVYYVSNCATGRIIRLLVADVSGHGEAVTGVADLLLRLMRRYINQIDQIHFVRAMNSSFSTLSRDGLFATAVVATYFTPTHTLTLTNAGHPSPALYEAGSGKWSYLTPQSVESGRPTVIPLGILDISDYETQASRLKPGDVVMCYTDALIECRNPKGERLGMDGLMKVLQRLDMDERDRIIPALLDSLNALHIGNLKDDDITVRLRF